MSIVTSCNEQVFKDDDEKLNRIKSHYFTALCDAHIEVINTLIEHYKLLTYDYFPYNITPWDVPVWSIVNQKESITHVILRYKDWDFKPHMQHKDKNEIYNLISSEELQNSL